LAHLIPDGLVPIAASSGGRQVTSRISVHTDHPDRPACRQLKQGSRRRRRIGVSARQRAPNRAPRTLACDGSCEGPQPTGSVPPDIADSERRGQPPLIRRCRVISVLGTAPSVGGSAGGAGEEKRRRCRGVTVEGRAPPVVAHRRTWICPHKTVTGRLLHIPNRNPAFRGGSEPAGECPTSEACGARACADGMRPRDSSLAGPDQREDHEVLAGAR
jgi:hypothetical protein